MLTIYTLCFICPPVHDNDSHAITGTSVASDTTLSISLSNSELPLDITPTSSNGTFVSTADDDTKASTAVIHVATNNITGYTLGIKASNPASSSADKLISNNEKCENTPTSNKCAISSLSQPVSSEDYINNTIEGIDLNNTWGYAPSHYNSTPNTTTTTTLDPNTNENITTTSPINYYPAPVNGDTIATTDTPNQENTTANDGTLLEDEYTIDYGMRIDYTPYTGTYSTNYNNQSYIITAVGNLVPYSVSYNANKPEQAQTDTTVDNMPTAQADNVQGGDTVAVPLSQKVPTIGTVNPTTGDYDYAGYVFNGWCTVQPEEDQVTGYQTCPDNARVFQPGDNFGIDQTVDNTQILYAVWGAPAKVTFDSNGLIFDDTTTPETTNTLQYIPTYEGGIITGNRTNTIYTGTYKTPTLLTAENYIFKGWSTDQDAAEATYMDEQDIMNNINLNADDAITLYAIWAYTTVITFDGNGADSGTMEPIVVEAGKTEALPQNNFAKASYYFVGWNTEADGSGIPYKNQDNYIAAVGSNNVVLYAQWIDCAPNNICYNDNGANSPTTMSTQSASSNRDVELWASNYKYDTNNDGHNDYGFAGWSEDKDAAAKLVDNDSTNNPVVYGPNQTITTGDLSVEGMKLYAVWIAPLENTTFQDFTCPTNEDMPIGTVIALKDNRDNEVYTVAKLADGNCWMTENLRLDNNATINATNTNGPISSFTALSPSSDSWCTGTYAACIDQSKLNTNNIANPVSPMTRPYANIYSYGNYSNWYSATAGNGTYSISSGTVSGDICPAGWHLPYGGNTTSEKGGNTSGGFYYLNQQMGGNTSDTGSNNWRSFPNNFVYSGNWDGSSAYNRGYNGYYWSSTAGGTSNAYILRLYSGVVNPTGYDNKYNGYSVRCVISQ